MKSTRLVLGLLLAGGAATAQQYTISTFAGIGTSPGFYPVPGDGAVSAPTAQIYSPGALALDHSGNLYIADYLSRVIWEVTGGNINPPVVGTTSPGSSGNDGPAVLATIYQVRGLAVDPGGNLYIADAGSANVRIVNPSGQINGFAGNGTSGYSGDGGASDQRITDLTVRGCGGFVWKHLHLRLRHSHRARGDYQRHYFDHLRERNCRQ